MALLDEYRTTYMNQFYKLTGKPLELESDIMKLNERPCGTSLMRSRTRTMQSSPEPAKINLWISILLLGIGVSSIGDFIYLVALNIFVLNQTHSPVAVAGLWAVARIAALFVAPWAGSVTDRLSHRKQLVTIELIRAVCIGILPMLSQIGWIYLVLFFLGVCTTFFGNAYLPYQTVLVPQERRQRVNSLSSTLRSGSILLGPAIAGLLLQRGSTSVAIWLDAASFLFSAITLFLLPNFPPESAAAVQKRRFGTLRSDWRDAVHFLRNNALYTTLFSMSMLVMAFGMTADAQEVVFATNALHLGQFGYGMMVVAAGVGFVSGSLILSIVAKRITTAWLIAVGQLVGAIGYLVYSLSYSFWWAVAGLVILGLFGSAANVGFTTYTQQAVPVSYMGRINNVLGPPQQILSILLILIGGYLASTYGVRALMVTMTIPMCVVALCMSVLVFMPQNRVRVSEDSISA